jgi:hypothetical protein
MAKGSNKQNIKKSFGKRKAGMAKKKLNKHECKKEYNGQGR